MSFTLDKVADIVLDTVIDIGKEKADEILEERKLKKVLCNSIKEYIRLQKISDSKKETEFVLDKKSITDLDKRKIMPNLTVEKLEENLREIIDKCIITDDKDKARIARKYICHSYKLGVAGLISISQVSEDIHSIEKNVRESERKISAKIDKGTQRIIQEMQKRPAQQLNFIDELDDSRVYCYILLQLTKEVENDSLQELADSIFAEYDAFWDKQKIFCVSFNFYYPITQYDLKCYLKCLNESFAEENVGILSIVSHF